MRKSLHRTLYAALGIVAIAAMDLSSYCHPDPGSPDMALIGAAKAAAPVVTDLGAFTPITSVADHRELTWAELADVDFKDVYLEELDSYYWKPEFGPKVMAAESKDVYITGYVIPVDLDEDFYVLSRYPFANCFFCGGAGPESVVDLRFLDSDHRTYQTDERLTFHGNLSLNADDVYQMNYILVDAEEHPL
ncbi:MAG: DUF3299 domain-containing protein [Flavobacteriales bacterium]|nr:DUF3299 domain-containing protein [Flavobacteriales bacterium]